MQYKIHLLSLFITLCLLAISIQPQATTIQNETFSLSDHTVDIVRISPKKLQALPEEKQNMITTRMIPNNDQIGPTFSQSVLPNSVYPIQQFPAMATHGENILMLAETNNNTFNPGKITATSSTTNGTTWTYHMTLSHDQTAFTTPSLDYTGDPSMQAFGSTIIDMTTGIQMIYCFPSLTDPLAVYEGDHPDFDRSGWFSGRMISWDPSYWSKVTDTATAGYPHGIISSPYKDFHGLTLWGGHDGSGWSYYFYCDTDKTTENDFKILWKNYLKGTLINIDCDIDLTTGWEYDLCELLNHSTWTNEIYMDMLFLEPGNREWFNNDQNYGPSWVFRGYQQPSLKATNGCVYLACVKDHDIYLHRSTNKGYTYKTFQITNSSDHESVPEITVINDYIIVSFIKDHNLFTTISQDNGETWTIPQQINQNDGIVSDSRGHVCLDRDYVIWTETNENNTLSLLRQNIKTPQFIISDVNGGTNISFQITNIGTAAAEHMNYTIKFTDGWMISDRNITGTIDLAIGETKTVSTQNLNLGFGTPLITIQIGQTRMTVPSTLILFYLIINQ